jgi:iron complex transport system substrate-binding protein
VKRQITENPVLTLTDDSGVEFKFDRYPQKIISLAPNITETIFALHSDSLLVGVTKYCNYPPEASKKKIVGGMIDPDIELITELRPDLILITNEGNSKASYQALVNAGFKVFAFNPRDIDGIIRMIKSIGIITDKSTYANQLSDSILNSKINFERLSQTSKPFSALILLSLNPLITCNSTTYINQIIELSGFKNIYKNERLPYPNISVEDIKLKNPDYILLTSDIADSDGNYKIFLNDKFSGTKAIDNGNIIIADADLLSRPGPRVIQAIENILKEKER